MLVPLFVVLDDEPPCGADDGVGIDAVRVEQIGNIARLTKAVDAKRQHPLTVDATEPAERRRVRVNDGDDTARGRQVGEQLLDMR